MNSPVSCLPDPIQNMARNKPKKNKNSLRGKKINVPRPLPSRPSNAGFNIPGTAYGAVMGGKRMLPISSGVGKSMIVANYEQIGTGSALTGTGSFVSGGLVLNAGIAGNWPWLGSIAKNFQKFRYRFLRFIFVPQTPTTTPGSVWLYMQYDARDSAPTSVAEVAAAESAVVGNAWYGGPINPDIAFSKNLSLKDNIYLDVDCAQMSQPWYYTRVASGDTLNTVSLTGTATGGNGTLAIASGGTFEYTTRPGTIYFGNSSVTSTVVTGNLYMAYVCELSEPILGSLNV